MNSKKFLDLIAQFPCAGQLNAVQSCARAVVSVCGIQISQYTYAAGGKLYIAEKYDGEWQLREETKLHDTVRRLKVFIGDSSFSRTAFVLTLSFEEAACLLAVMDFYSLAALRRAAGVPESEPVSPDMGEILNLLANPRRGGLLSFLNEICPNISLDAERALGSLTAKELCSEKDGGYLLNDELSILASAAALPQAVVRLCQWEDLGETAAEDVPIAYSLSTAVQCTLHDILILSAKDDDVTLASVNANLLLDIIGETLACHKLTGIDGETDNKPVPAPEPAPPAPEPTPPAPEYAPPAPEPIPNEYKVHYATSVPKPASPVPPLPQYAPPPESAPNQISAPPAPEPTPPAPSAALWQCECGYKNTGKFCVNCGKPKPLPKPEANANEWVCECGYKNTGKFCGKCGKPRLSPNAEPESWVCGCGKVNTGRFCPVCGAKRP